MKASAAFNNFAINDITPAVLAIGRTTFPQALISALRRVADVGHCMVFSFEGERSACLLDAGNIPTGRDLGIAYAGHFHQSDPNRDAIFAGHGEAAPVLLPTFARRAYSDSYRKIFFDDSDIVDKFATAIWVDDTCFYVNFYRITAQGRFTPEQIRRLSAVAPAVSAAVARHFQLDATADGDPMGRLKTLFATGQPLALLTGREKEVCLRILSGLSSEAIAAELGISLHSALTYRKRAYERLGISSQNELFGIVLRLMASRSLN
ncbi:helix-turn-helix transcriptional regulator [Bradyrhizobium lablabi]|uniref:helix-turn-helix transcriptional regulator n=1 Tax=Bradyrhizobium lablabi TaxID=722472 RepID=UPI001BA96391|nr:helix-turn-helix transcriptional regulator [Bradyrhizobium lablabi]MBR1121737.1 helix-turn-helix transcriptional regulator [Bradyrhizobium lablabi]